MANFTTRIELHNHDDGDYDLLHTEMRKELFYQAIRYNKIWYDLPSAEYNKTSILTTAQIFSSAKKATQIVIDKKPYNNKQEKKDFWVVVTKSDGSREIKLKKTIDSSKLPPGEKLS